MNISKAQRKELDTLSKTLFGSSSRWQKLIDKGYDELVTEEVEESVPSEKEGEAPTVKKVQAPVLSAAGARQYVRKYHTLDSIVVFLNEQKEQFDKLVQARNELIAQINAENEAKKAKEDAEKLAKEVHSNVSGSAQL